MQSKRDLFEDLELYGKTDTIPLAMGAPGPSAISGCKDIMIQATLETMSNPEEERYIFQYGPRQGDPGFLDELATFLSNEYGDPNISSNNLMVTAGATHGLQLTASVLFNNNLPIFVEDPTYFIGIKVLQHDLGIDVVPVQMESDGIDTVALEKAFQEHRPKAGDKSTWKCPFWTMLYTMTVYHNPTGINTSPKKCRELIRLARKYDVLLFTEDVYNMMHYGKEKPPVRLLEYDRSEDPEFAGHVLSNCTFSKIFAPGMRLGWIEAKGQVLPLLIETHTAHSGGSFNHYTSRIIATALKQGFISNHLQRLRDMYRERMQIVCNNLMQYLPEGSHFDPPKGAFFVWIALPEYIDALDILKLAVEKYNVNFLPGHRTSPKGHFKNYIRLSISFPEKDEVEIGIARLGKAIQEYVLSVKSA